MASTVAGTRERRSVGRSILAVFVGFVVVILTSLVADQILHMLGVYPPWGVPMYSVGLNLLALGYRFLFTMLGGWVVARLAPNAPMRHVVVFAAIGLLLGILGNAAAMTRDLGPVWYPVAVAITGPIAAWLGGKLYVDRRAR